MSNKHLVSIYFENRNMFVRVMKSVASPFPSISALFGGDEYWRDTYLSMLYHTLLSEGSTGTNLKEINELLKLTLTIFPEKPILQIARKFVSGVEFLDLMYASLGFNDHMKFEMYGGWVTGFGHIVKADIFYPDPMPLRILEHSITFMSQLDEMCGKEKGVLANRYPNSIPNEVNEVFRV